MRPAPAWRRDAPKEKTMSTHIVASYDEDLKALDDMVLTMGRAVIRQHREASELTSKHNSALAGRIVDADRGIDDMQHAIEERAIQTIAKRQPMAIDLRTVIATLKIATDLERIGDLVKNNAKRMMATSSPTHLPPGAASLELFNERVGLQLERMLTAFERRDGQIAHEVWLSDVEIDRLQSSLFRELLTYMMEDPRNIGPCTHLLFCARNLERIGDHATNIAEQVHYIISGKTMPTDRPKGDVTASQKAGD
jgi:phosphate transport system protein